jgi:hypothetical protein
MVTVVSLSHYVAGLKQSLHICGEGLPRLIPFLDLTHLEDSGFESTLISYNINLLVWFNIILSWFKTSHY